VQSRVELDVLLPFKDCSLTVKQEILPLQTHVVST